VSGDVHHHSANEFAPAAAPLPTALKGLLYRKEKQGKPASALTVTLTLNIML